ncbi:DEAD/DEAH box helicase family protein [Pseudomonas donghuensis]|uniref:DEAD/DEAH box helicase family protein n=1 Tax=Pseudomonas donghuensis TaxID=1163398 RepID=UPI002852ECD7|nr:DEAD/DEAH box helicase family protein [Pseudomonas donghuensis]
MIIADESHRSIYNKYRDLFDYFDALQVGLTATPVKFISRNTFDIFDCENHRPHLRVRAGRSHQQRSTLSGTVSRQGFNHRFSA